MSKRFEPAIIHLHKGDARLGRVIQSVGPCKLVLRRNRFESLVRAIISQQISTAAARSIRERLHERLGEVTPEAILDLPEVEFRGCGVSPQKIRYLRDLAEHVHSGRVPLNRIGRLSDEEVIARLTNIKGIGRWTAQMFLMFSLGRPDVLPHDDLGIRNAIRRLYELGESPSRDVIDEIAAPWRPHATVACWYLWRSLENVPA